LVAVAVNERRGSVLSEYLVGGKVTEASGPH